MAIDLNGSTGISLDDNEKINLGSSNDLQIYHDGSHSYVKDAGTGNLKIQGENVAIENTSGDLALYYVNTGVNLYHNGSTKLATTSSGVTVTGNIANASGDLTLDVSGDIILDADGTDVRLAKGGVQYGMFTTNSTPLGFYIDALVQDGDLFFRGNDGGSTITAMTIDMSEGGKVGIGTSPAYNLHIEKAGNQFIFLNNASTNDGFYFKAGTGASSIQTNGGSNVMNFFTSGNERMRIDSSGNFMVGKTNIQDADSGFVVEASGFTNHHRDSGTVSVFDRGTDNGDIVQFRRDGTVHGAIGRGGSGFFIAGVASTDFGVVFDGSGLLSSNDDGVLRDNQYNIGHGSYRWTNIYATNGSINTSDQTEKQDIAPLTATEMLVAKRISAMFKNYRWKDKVTTEGDSARNHTGIIAQDVQAAFTAESLDASNYGLFCSDTWWETQTEVPAVEAVAEVTDEDGNVTTEAVEAVDAYTRTDTYDTEAEAPEGATERTRLGIRYPELLSFVAAYNEQRFASIEARLTALEA